LSSGAFRATRLIRRKPLSNGGDTLETVLVRGPRVLGLVERVILLRMRMMSDLFCMRS
jgi:hypothetical protein